MSWDNHKRAWSLGLVCFCAACQASPEDAGADAGAGADETDASLLDAEADDESPRDADEPRVPADGGETDADDEADVADATDPLRAVTITSIGTDLTYYATFQSHNQRVVSTAGGYFMGYLLSRNDSAGGGQWRISRSIDAGLTWTPLYTSATTGSSPPALATDPDGNLYAASVNFLDASRPAYITKWSAGDYSLVATGTYPGFGGAGKYTLVYDECRDQLVYASYDGQLLVVDPDDLGASTSHRVMSSAGEHAWAQYPHLFMVGCELYHAWTTSFSSTSYYSIHAAKSPDGGTSWFQLQAEACDGSDEWWTRNEAWRLPSPFNPDDTPPSSTQVSYTEENGAHTWLSNMIVHRGKIHFAYWAQTYGDVYTRFDDGPGYRECTQRGPTGATVRPGLFGAFFVQDGDALYLVGGDSEGRIAVIRSDDNGDSWSDFALSEETFGTIYAVSGSPRLTLDGNIVGMFTDQRGEIGDAYFFRVQTR